MKNTTFKQSVYGRAAAFLICLAMLIPCLFTVPTAFAEEVPVYSLRLFSLRFSDGDASSVFGVDGTQYNVSIKQLGSADVAVTVRLYFNNVGGEKWLSVTAGEKRGDYREFNVKDYRALQPWVLFFRGINYSISPMNANIDVSNIDCTFTQMQEILRTAPLTSVLDGNGKALFRQFNGLVINEDFEIIVDDQTNGLSSPVFHNDGKFTNEYGEELQVSEPMLPAAVSPASYSGGAGVTLMSAEVASVNMLDGVKMRYLLSHERKIISVQANKEVYRVTVRDRKDSEPYTIICMMEYSYVQTGGPTFWNKLGLWLGTRTYESFEEWYDITGNRIAVKNYYSFKAEAREAVWTPLIIIQPVWKLFMPKSIPTGAGTIGDYMAELGEQILVPGGEWWENIAVDVATGDTLYDNNMNPIRKDGGQLKDFFYWPIVASDARPCRYDNTGYYSYDGKLMTVNSQRQLVDSTGAVIRSVSAEIEAGNDRYFGFLKDGKTRIPGNVRWDQAALNGVGDWVFTDENGNDATDEMADFIVGDKTTQKQATEKAMDAFVQTLTIIGIIALCVVGAGLIGFIVYLIVKLFLAVPPPKKRGIPKKGKA